MSIIERVLSLIAPHECLGCRQEGSLLCDTCTTELRTVPARCYRCQRWSEDFRTCPLCRRQTPLFRVTAVAEYGGLAKAVLHQLKFARARAGADAIAQALVAALPAADSLVITHIPTVPQRIRERGYDQAALIAKAVARRLDQPYASLLIRQGSGRQVGQRREVRKRQMSSAFRPRQLAALQGKHVLVIDDVLTTGATCEAAARALRQAGAKRVSAAVFAVA